MLNRIHLGILVYLILPLVCVAQDHRNGAVLDLQIGRIMQSRYAAGDFSGTVLVAREGKILYEHAFGLANREWVVSNDLETKFEIGSMTKQFTALLVLQMVHEGRLRLDGHVSDYLPFYRRDTGSRVTISELLSHTSGVPNFISLPGFLDGAASRTHYEVKDFVQEYCSGDLEFDPGTKFKYSNSGYSFLAPFSSRFRENRTRLSCRNAFLCPWA